MKILSPANEWGWTETLLNNIDYRLRVLAWQNTEDAHSKHPRNYPEPWRPSFLPKLEKAKRNPEEASMDIDDMKAFLSRERVSGK